jgi:uncharacterized phiE125 gp8 family phage protein
MTLFRTLGPEAEPVTLGEAKANLRIDHDSEDTLIAGLIRAAREEVESTTSVAMIDQHWRLAVDELPASGMLRLRRGPVKEVLSVTLYGADGEASMLDPGLYQLDALSNPARLHFSDRPPALRAMNGIEVDFVAGHGEAGTDVPDLLKRAVLMLVAHWFEFRATFGAKDQPVSLPEGYRRLVAAYAPRRLA